jgi:hypothetical protein
MAEASISSEVEAPQITRKVSLCTHTHTHTHQVCHEDLTGYAMRRVQASLSVTWPQEGRSVGSRLV